MTQFTFMKPYILLILFANLFLINLLQAQQTSPKREFRGVWVQTVYQDRYKNMTPAEMRGYFIYMLDYFQKANFNTVVFQVRPQADAFYPSSLEPWSSHLTGTQGRAPSPYWDPMAFLIRECHKRNMEFHAWLNPYRVTVGSSERLASSHIYNSHPEWFVKYDGKIYFDPGIPDCRKFICDVVEDIVERYDVDAIHMDDYFYPYPAPGVSFPDENSFRKYGNQQGFYSNKDDWRRNNVNNLIKEIKETIVNTGKPSVKFGISPFGIYRNKKNTPDGSGSNTDGLENYGDLYADVLLWARNGWIDYLIPQIYWEIGHKKADYETLIYWWNQHVSSVQLYIGQDVERSIKTPDARNPRKNQLSRKMELERTLPNVSGNCFWYGYAIMDNYGGITDSLVNNYHKYPALIPSGPHGNKKILPDAPRKIHVNRTPAGKYKLTWEIKTQKEYLKNPVYYCIYRFEKKERVNLNNAEKIVKITRETEYILPYNNGKTEYKYVVTSVNKLHDESKKGKEKKVKL